MGVVRDVTITFTHTPPLSTVYQQAYPGQVRNETTMKDKADWRSYMDE